MLWWYYIFWGCAWIVCNMFPRGWMFQLRQVIDSKSLFARIQWATGGNLFCTFLLQKQGLQKVRSSSMVVFMLQSWWALWGHFYHSFLRSHGFSAYKQLNKNMCPTSFLGTGMAARHVQLEEQPNRGRLPRTRSWTFAHDGAFGCDSPHSSEMKPAEKPDVKGKSVQDVKDQQHVKYPIKAFVKCPSFVICANPHVGIPRRI